VEDRGTGGGVERANVSVGCICRGFESRTGVALVSGLVCPQKEAREWATAGGKRAEGKGERP
jgi:hypothetical protein